MPAFIWDPVWLIWMKTDDVLAQKLNRLDSSHSDFDSLNFSAFWELTTLNALLWLSQAKGAGFDFMVVITRSKSENNFFTSALGSDGYGS